MIEIAPADARIVGVGFLNLSRLAVEGDAGMGEWVSLADLAEQKRAGRVCQQARRMRGKSGDRMSGVPFTSVARATRLASGLPVAASKTAIAA